MIARLRGTVVGVDTDHVVVDVGGVGYRVFVPGRVLAGLTLDEPLLLYTQLVVRENDLSLYGAPDPASVAMFNLLLGVNGVGPRLALAMLTAFTTEVLAQAIAAEDIAALTQVPGVGRRTAQRVVLDLKGRVAGDLTLAGVAPTPDLVAGDDAVAALAGLGYSAVEARQALAAVPVTADMPLETQVLLALRRLSAG